jgi:hypothetical protein
VGLSGHTPSHAFGTLNTDKIYETPDVRGRMRRAGRGKDGDFIVVEYDVEKYGHIYKGSLN